VPSSGRSNEALIRMRSWLTVGSRCSSLPWSQWASGAANTGPPAAASPAPTRKSRLVVIDGPRTSRLQ
jgi:hypothetical protein